jgi:uncharacterized protein with GYD domain
MIKSYKLIKEKLMKKYIVMGNYTAKAFQGFMKDPSQDRSAAATQLSKAVGGKMESFDIVRGTYDFVGVITGDVGFEATAAVKLAVESTGTITNFTILEKMDINKTAELAVKAMAGYKPAG